MKVLLLDADILAFKVAAVSQTAYRWSDDQEPVIHADEWEDVVPRIHRSIRDLTEALGTDHVIVCLSCPTAENWRMDVLPSYKGNRDYSKRPVYLAAIKEYMEATWPSYRRDTLEADDIMGILSTMKGLPSNFVKEYPEFDGPISQKIIVSEDKDMRTIPGWLFNPAKHTQPECITAESADRFHLWQTICGDTTDGYAGCPGAGPTAASHVLDLPSVWTPQEYMITRGPRKGTSERRYVLEAPDPSPTPWESVVSLYERYGYTEEDALVQARVARICRSVDFDFINKKVILWTPT